MPYMGSRTPRRNLLAGIGWVLIHRKALPGQKPGPKEFSNSASLRGWLKHVWKTDRLWHWKRSRLLNEGGPYTALVGFDGNIWGDVKVRTTHKISARVSRRDFNFAFYFLEPPSLLPAETAVKLVSVVGDHLAHHHRDLIVLDDEMLDRYNRFKLRVR